VDPSTVLVEVIMAWLLRRGEVLASIDVVRTPMIRLRGMAARDPNGAALYCVPSKMAHTMGVRFPVDVAFIDEELVVMKTTALAPFRVAIPCLRAHSVLQAGHGAFTRWSLAPGDHLEIRD